MYKLLIISLFSIVLCSCSSDDEPEATELIGTWKLTEMYSDPGDGSGSFRPVDSQKTIQFMSNETFQSNGTLCHLSLESNSQSRGTFSESSKTIAPEGCEIDVDLTYEFKSGNLIIYYFCIEGCGEKFKKIN